MQSFILLFVPVFFTHCHPVRAIIHKPSFSASLSHNRVPSYLLYAICALAAPLSRQPRIRTAPPRLSGRPFAQEALSLMFDGSGQLLCPNLLTTAQALCLLMVHELVVKDTAAPANLRYRGTPSEPWMSSLLNAIHTRFSTADRAGVGFT